jgi:REP element-mobilizing transposase RayT
MPRISRKNITSKYIHAIIQGIKKEYIFEDDEYKKEYINLLYRIIEKFQYTKILAYCIMDNHAHFLIYTEKIEELSRIMSRVNTSYGIFYNNREKRVGYVFKNRYYTQEILDEKHLLNTFAYIHRNPVKAKIVNKEEDYIFSSYNMYAQKKVDSNLSKLIFNTNDYINEFYFIHENLVEDNIIDIKEEQETVQKIMEKTVLKFCNEYNCNIDYIKKDNYLLMLLIKEIKSNCYTTNKLISEYIKIGKNRIYNLSIKEKNK